MPPPPPGGGGTAIRKLCFGFEINGISTGPNEDYAPPYFDLLAARPRRQLGFDRFEGEPRKERYFAGTMFGMDRVAATSPGLGPR